MNRKWSTVRGGGHSARSHAQLKQHQIEDRATVTDPLTSKLTNNIIAIGLQHIDKISLELYI